MKWSKDKSLMLSKICIFLFGAMYLTACCIAPWLNKIIWYTALIGATQYIVITIYMCAPPVFIALWCLYKLLANISAELVFIPKNVQYLRKISWCLIWAAIIFLLSMSYAWSFGILATVAVFMGIILRVVKNVFAQAVALQTENDLTI